MSTTTENLGLTKPELSENFDLSVWNGNTDILDAFAGQVNSALTAKQDELTEAQIAAANSGITASKLSTDEAALLAMVESGAKNKLHIDAAGAGTANGLTFTYNSDGSVTVSGSKTNPANASYAYLRYNNASVTADAFCDGKHFLSGCPAGGGSSTYRLYVAKGSYVAYDDGQGALLTATAETGIQIIIAIVAGYDLTEPITFKPMICSSADWALSTSFKTYCPTLQELYQMFLASQ